MDDYENQYEFLDDEKDQQKVHEDVCESQPLYIEPELIQQTPNEYQLPQIVTYSKNNKPASDSQVTTNEVTENNAPTVSVKVKDNNYKKCLTIITFFIVVFFVIMLLGLALVVYNFHQRVRQEASSAQTSSQLLSEIQALKSQLSQVTNQLNLNINETTHDSESAINELNSSLSFNELSDQIWHNLSDFVAEQNSVKDTLKSHLIQLQQQLTIALTNITSLNNRNTDLQRQLFTTHNRVDTIQTQLNTTQTNVTLVSSQVNSLQTSINSRLSTPVNVYQNCRQDKSSCNITILNNDNRRVYCSTITLSANISGFYTVGMKCEYKGKSQLEVPSLQTTDGYRYYCQCSVLIPSSNGFTELSSSQDYGNCTLVVTRCPLSQTIT